MLFNKILTWLDKQWYKPVYIELITWTEDDIEDGIAYDMSTLTFYENGYGKRKVEYTTPKYSNLCKPEHHPYWHNVVLPWLANIESNKKVSSPIIPGGNKVIKVNFKKKK